MPAANNDNMIVEVSGMLIGLPKTVKFRSPGKRPIPNLRKKGIALENKMSAMLIAIIQRIMKGLGLIYDYGRRW